ncbi:MAG: ferredoxin [bacterium]|nr:ferredoxin [bacterium]
MADVSERYEDNAPGKHYIDKTCAFCSVCIDEAPDNIKESDDGDHCIVFKQASNDAEAESLKNAIDACPTGSIGDDGE